MKMITPCSANSNKIVYSGPFQFIIAVINSDFLICVWQSLMDDRFCEFRLLGVKYVCIYMNSVGLSITKVPSL